MPMQRVDQLLRVPESAAGFEQACDSPGFLPGEPELFPANDCRRLARPQRSKPWRWHAATQEEQLDPRRGLFQGLAQQRIERRIGGQFVKVVEYQKSGRFHTKE